VKEPFIIDLEEEEFDPAKPAAPEVELAFEFQPLDVFGDEEEPDAEPLIGTAGETVLPKGGTLIMYGDGGVGKTTLGIDAAFHLAAGVDWLEIPVPVPFRVTILENEGPRGKLRQQLREKREWWEETHPDLPLKDEQGGYRIHIAKNPWGKWNLSDELHRKALAVFVNQHGINVLICGPLATLGMIGGGTPDEVAVFEGHLTKLRDLLDEPLAIWLTHHENKQGDVSGAWERMPDTLVHVQARGNGHTHLVWQKARWASALHQTSLDLDWTDGKSYEVVEKEEPVALDVVMAEVAAAVLAATPPVTDTTIREAVPRGTNPVTEALAALAANGVLFDAESRHGRGISRKYWHRDHEGAPLALFTEFHSEWN